MVGHEWYYLDPTKGYAVIRAELFNLPADAPADAKADSGRQTIRLEDYQISPQGFWYPRVIHNPRVTVHYHFDFRVALPDWLFAIDDVTRSRK